MRRMTCFVMALVGILAIGGRPAQGNSPRFLILPEKSQVGFVSGTQLGEFRGDTRQVGGEVVLDPQRAGLLRLAVSVDLRTLKSDNAARDQHMHENLLEVGRFPRAAFTAREFRRALGVRNGNGEGTLSGNLTLHGVERAVSLPIRFAVNGTMLQGEGTLSVRLTDFNMTPPRLLGLKVRDLVTLEIRLVAASE